MIKKLAVAAALFAIGIIIARQRSRSRNFFQRKFVDKLSGSFKASALGALGATAPASPALPSIPLIPAL